MNKIFIKTVLCGMLVSGLGATQIKAQNTLESVLENLSSSSSGNTGKNVISGLTSIFSSSKVATADKIVGTWVYEEPAVVFESSNMLKKAGGTIVSSRIEKKLQAVLTKYGIKKGNMKMTFTKDGKFTQTIAKRTVSGTYTIDGKNVKLKYTGGVSQLFGTTQIDGNSLLIVMNATKLMKFAGIVGNATGNSLLKTAGSLLSGMDGMECGVRMKKVK